MPRVPLIVALCLALGACASARAEKLVVCDGQHRRPANPNGSVLAATQTPAPAAASKPEPRAELSASYQPCQGRA